MESATVPMTKQLNSVTARPVPAPARMRPAGRKRYPARASAKASACSRRHSGFSAWLAAKATRPQLSTTSPSIGVPSGCRKRYFMSQI